MRALVATGLLALALSGCDYFNPPAQHTAAVTAPAPCNCIAQKQTQESEHVARVDEHATYRHRHHYRGYAHSSHSYREYANADMAQYEYSSSSSVSDDQGDYYRHYEDQADEYRGGSHHEGWTDGYGRTHYGSATRVATDDGNRLDPWHDYNKHCPDRE